MSVNNLLTIGTDDDRVQVNVPHMLRACLLVLCRVASSEHVVSSKAFKRTIRLTCSLLTMETVVTDCVCFNNIMLFCRNIVAFGKQDMPLIHEYLSGSILRKLGLTMHTTVDSPDKQLIETNLRLVAADTVCYLLFHSSSALRHAMAEEQAPRSSTDSAPIGPSLPTVTGDQPVDASPHDDHAVFAKMGKLWHAHMQNMNSDELSGLGSMDDKLHHVYTALYGAKDETQLFLDLLSIHANIKAPAPILTQQAPSPTVELSPTGPNVAQPVPAFYMLEHSTPSDLRNYTFFGGAMSSHVPGSPFSWKVLRKLMAGFHHRNERLKLSNAQLASVVELLSVCHPNGAKNEVSRSSQWWLVELESEFIRFVHDIVHTHAFLQASDSTFHLSTKTALRYFHSAAVAPRDKDTFSKHFRGFVILHAFANHPASMLKLCHLLTDQPPPSAPAAVTTPDAKAETDAPDDEDRVPRLATECLQGVGLGKRKVTWTKREHGKQPFAMTYFVTDVSHSKLLPYALGVLTSLYEHDARFLLWFLQLDGLDVLVDVLDLELEHQHAPVIPSRVFVLLTTLRLLKESVELRPEAMGVLSANPRIFLRLVDLTSHVKTHVKQVAMALLAAMTAAPWVSQGVYSMQAFEDLPVFGQEIDDSVLLQHKLKQLKSIFGTTAVERDGGYVFVDTNTTVDLKKFTTLSNLRFFRMLKLSTLVKLTKALDSWTTLDSKHFMVCADGRPVTMPLWLVEKYVSEDIMSNPTLSSHKRTMVLDIVSKMGVKLARHGNVATDKGHRLTRDDYMSSVDVSERKLVATSIWKTIHACVGVPKMERFRFTQQMYRVLLEDHARLLRSRRLDSVPLTEPQGGALYPFELYGFLRTCVLLRSLDMEKIGAMCRRMSSARAFCADMMTGLVVVCRGTVTVSYKPSVFSFQRTKAAQWKRSFGRGEVVWCPSWLSTDPRIERFDWSRFKVDATVHTTVFEWTQALHDATFSSETLSRLSVDISALVDSIVVHKRRPRELWSHEMTSFAVEEAQLRQLQVHCLTVLGHVAQVPDMAKMLVNDISLINVVVGMALSSLEDVVVMAAVQTLQRLCTQDAGIARHLLAIPLDLFQGHSLLDGLVDAIDIWRMSRPLTSEVLVLMRHLYKFVPEVASSIPTTWTEPHYQFFQQCLVQPDNSLIHRNLTALVVEALVQAPSVVSAFTAGGLHWGFARLVHSCDQSLLCDVLHLMLLFCQDEPTRRSLWADRTYHRDLKPTLCAMSTQLEDGFMMERDVKYLDFFNLLLHGNHDPGRCRQYRDYVGARTTLIKTLTGRIVSVELSPEHRLELQVCIECLWRLCFEHQANAKLVMISCDQVTDILAVVANLFERTHHDQAFQISVLHLIRSLCTDPEFATNVSAVSLQKQLIECAFSSRPDTMSTTRRCGALQAVNAALEHSSGARSALTSGNLSACLALYSSSSVEPQLQRDAMQFLRFACIDPSVRRMVWQTQNDHPGSIIGWKSTLQTIAQCQTNYVNTRNQVHQELILHTLGLIAELCLDEATARTFCAYEDAVLPRVMFELATTQASGAIVFQLLRVVVTLAEYMHQWADPRWLLCEQFGTQPQILRLATLLGEKGCNALVLRFLWLWEQQQLPVDSNNLVGDKASHPIHVYAAESLCKLDTTAAERTMFLGYLGCHLKRMVRNGCDLEGLSDASSVAGHICACFRHVVDCLSLQDLGSVPDNWLSYFSWSQDPQYIPYAQVWLLMELVVMAFKMDKVELLQLTRSFRQALEFCTRQAICIIESILSSIHALVGNNSTLCLWLAKSKVDILQWLVDLVNVNTDATVETLVLAVLHALVAQSYRFAANAIGLDVPFLCVRRSILATPECAYLWLRLLGRLVMVCGATKVYGRIDEPMTRELCLFLMSTAASDLNTESNWRSWHSSTTSVVGSALFNKQLVSEWTSCGSSFVATLLNNILTEPIEDAYRAAHSLSLVKILIGSKNDVLVQTIFSLHHEMATIVKHAISFQSPPSPQKQVLPLELLHSLLLSVNENVNGSTLFESLSDALAHFDTFPVAYHPVCFDLLSLTLAAKVHLRHPTTPSLGDVLPTVPWSHIVHLVLSGLHSSEYRLQISSLGLLDALFTYSSQCTVREFDFMDISLLKATLSTILEEFTTDSCLDNRLEAVCRSQEGRLCFAGPFNNALAMTNSQPRPFMHAMNTKTPALGAHLFQDYGAMYSIALTYTQRLDLDAKTNSVHNLVRHEASHFGWGCSFVVYRTVNSDTFHETAIHAMLVLLYNGLLHSGDGNGEVLANMPFMHCLLRFAASQLYLSLREMATAFIWKALHRASVPTLYAFCSLVSQCQHRLLGNLYDNIQLETPVVGVVLAARDECKDLLLSTCGLLCELSAGDTAMSAAITSKDYIRDLLGILQGHRPSQLNAINIQFWTMMERLIDAGFTELHSTNPGLLLHCLHCLALDNSDTLRFQAIYVLYLFCQHPSGLDLLQSIVFPGITSHHVATTDASGDASPFLPSGHLYALTESLKCNRPRPQRAAMYLVSELCHDPQHATTLRLCRQSPTSVTNLVAHVLAATLGTTHRNRVQFRGKVDVSEPDDQFNLVTGCFALSCLQRLDVHVCLPAATLLCQIFRYASTPNLDEAESSTIDDMGDDLGDIALLKGHLRSHPLNRMKCFRHKVTTQIPSYVKLLADWVDWFCSQNHPEAYLAVLGSVLEVLSTSVQLFFPTIYFPIHSSTRVHHQRLLDNVFDLAFGHLDHSSLGDADAATVQVEALGVLAHLCSHVEYPCVRFEHPDAMVKLLALVETAFGKLQLVAGQLLQAVTKHSLVKECIYAHDLLHFIAWINQPSFEPILEPLLHTVKHLVTATPSHHYNATTIATLLLKASGQPQIQTQPPATMFRRIQLHVSVKPRDGLGRNPTFDAQIELDDNVVLHRRLYLPNSMHTELTWLHSTAGRTLRIRLARDTGTELRDPITVLHVCGTTSLPTVVTGADTAYFIETRVTDATETDLQSLTGPLGQVLKYCVQQMKVAELGLLSGLIGELCKHDDVFCNPDLNLWCFIAYLLQHGSALGDTGQGMQCLRAIAATASTQHPQLRTFVSHVMYLIQLLAIYGMSALSKQVQDTKMSGHSGHHCMRNKESITFLVALADMVAGYGSVSFAEDVMRQLFLEHRGVVMYLCGQHRGMEHACSGYFYIQWHLMRTLPSHTILLSQACFIQMNLRHFVESAHASDDSVDQATKVMLHIVSNSVACHQFVVHNVAQLLMANNTARGIKHIAPVLRQLVLVASFLSENMLSQVPLPQEVERLFFPSAVTKDVMPFLEILLWPLMPAANGVFTWTDSSVLAAKVLSTVIEMRSSRLLLENHLIHICFRLKGASRVEAVQAAIAMCLECTAWDQKHAVDVIQRVYFVAIRKGIKLGMLSAECTELLPQTTSSKTDQHEVSRKSVVNHSSKRLHVAKSDGKTAIVQEALTPYRDQLLHCLSFTEQHREGRLRDILVRSRKKGISDMLSAVNNAARVLVLVHNVLQMFFETYVSVVSSSHIEYSDVKVKKVRYFCKQLESIAALVVSAVNQMEASYFGVIFAQLHDIKVHSTTNHHHRNNGGDPSECRNTMRGNMKKLLFILKRIIDKKKLKPLLDEQSFVEAEEILSAIRLDFAVNSRRRLGHAALDSASVADFVCEAAEIGGIKKFDQFITSTRYLYMRSMQRDDGTFDNLEDFMMGTSDSMTLKQAIKALLASIWSHAKSICSFPFRMARRLLTRWMCTKAGDALTDGAARSALRSGGSFTIGRSRHHNSTQQLVHAQARVLERRLTSPFPIASVLFCNRHEQAAKGGEVWRVLRQVGLFQAPANTSPMFPMLLKPNFVEDILTGIPDKKQELIVDHLLRPDYNNAVHCCDDVLEQRLTGTEIQLIMLNIEAFLARQDNNDMALYHVQSSTLSVNVWKFVVSPVYHTRLMHAHFVLSDLHRADSLAAAQALWQTLEKGHTLLTQAIRLSPMMKLKATRRKMSERQQQAAAVSRYKSWLPWKWHEYDRDGGEYDAARGTDDIRRKPMGVLYANYILPVCDRHLDDPLSDQMAWEHLVGEINDGKFPPWVFRVNDPHSSAMVRRVTAAYRAVLRGVIYLTFWRLEEYFLDLQDRSWPDGDVIQLACTRRTRLDEDIIDSIVVYKHFRKAMSELFRVWMLESGSLGLPLWQHWGYFVGGCIFPAVVLYIYLPTLMAYTDYTPRQTDYHMKWFLAGFFSLLFALVMWSIVLLVKSTYQMFRFFPVTRHYSNYLALFGLFSELVQHNSIPFSDGVKWATGYKLPGMIKFIGQLGITNFDFIHIGTFKLAYLKSFFASGILVLFLVVLKCANKFHKTYPALNTRLTKDLPPIVSGLLFVGIVNSFSSLLFCCSCDQYTDNPAAQESCFHQRNGSSEPFLYSYPDLKFTCWSPEHLPLAYVGLMGSAFFIPIGILGAGMSQVLFPLETLDIKFSPIIDLTSQLVKTITAISALFFTFRMQYMISIGFGLNLLLFIVTLLNKTSSIWYIGTAKSVIYVMSVWTSLCAFVNVLLESPSSGPIYYLNVGWFCIASLACAVLGVRLRFRNIREERARRERLRDYQLLNDVSELSRLTDMEEDILRRAAKPLTTEQLEATAPKTFMDAAKLKAEQLTSQHLPSHLEDFMRLAKQSAEKPTTSELMFMRRAKRLGHRITAFEDLERLSSHHDKHKSV
ncbi:hypothetical protein DYB34_001403 [Aphanomyces astaci]|uniref:Uncharacterized protein n=1 Tax=Aphanomyces astaci TaxID=112090 RepID=A0A418BSI9_APHAT|nr:hypothetical protein DYB34_001403 [Aphanomyces astaci]